MKKRERKRKRKTNVLGLVVTEFVLLDDEPVLFGFVVLIEGDPALVDDRGQLLGILLGVCLGLSFDGS